MLRVVIGLLFLGHGSQKLFGWFGGHGIEGTGGFLQSLGFRPGRPFAALGGLSEFGGGLLLVLGLFTPFAAAVLIAMMFSAATSVHAPNGLWITDNGFEYPLVMGLIATAIAFTGPGAASLDTAFGMDLAGVEWGIGALVVGLALGIASDTYRRVTLLRRERFPARGMRSPA